MEKSTFNAGNGSGMCIRPCCGGSRSWSRCLVRTFIALVALGLVFSVGVAMGARAVMHRLAYGLPAHNQIMRMDGNRMPGQKLNMMDDRTDSFMMAPGTAMMRYDGLDTKSASGTVKLIGSVTKIDGNRITVLDNGAKEQVVLSQADTMISSATAELTLSSLKIGQNLSISGATDANGNVTAKMIRVM